MVQTAVSPYLIELDKYNTHKTYFLIESHVLATLEFRNYKQKKKNKSYIITNKYFQTTILLYIHILIEPLLS